jgi:4-hydroxy-tetrahydrodipicolinate reductase
LRGNHDDDHHGNGPLGRAIEAALLARGPGSRVDGPWGARPTDDRTTRSARPPGRQPDDRGLRADAVVPNLSAGSGGGTRRFVIATTGWAGRPATVEASLREHGAAAVFAPNFSIGVVLFGRLVETATELFGPLEGFDPYLLEWHRRSKRDRPSGTAIDLTRRIVAGHPRLTAPTDLEVVSVRAGTSPGMHLVGFDAAGETVELRLTARDRSAYAAGVLAAADWLAASPREPGLHPFDPVVDELVARRPIAA